MHRIFSTRSALIPAALFLVITALGPGCKSKPPPPSKSLAYVEIKGKTALEIARVISAVFKEADYIPARLPANNKMMLMFEQQGNTGDMLMYGDWTSNKPWYRVKLSIKTLDSETELVECEAFRVKEYGDTRFEEETKLTHSKKGHFQELLDRVKQRLDSVSPN